MSDLTLTIVYDGDERGFDARKVLKMARSTLELLRAIERSITKKRRARARWDVNIYSLLDRAVVEFTARRSVKRDSFDLEVLRTIAKRTLGEKAT